LQTSNILFRELGAVVYIFEDRKGMQDGSENGFYVLPEDTWIKNRPLPGM
jgi:hypothetical protein